MKWLMIVFLTMSVMLCGCAYVNSFLGGLFGEKETQDQIETLIEETKASGELDLNKAIALFEVLKEKQKRNWFQEILFVVGIAGGTYLGTRRIRKSKVGSLVNKIFGVLEKKEG